MTGHPRVELIRQIAEQEAAMKAEILDLRSRLAAVIALCDNKSAQWISDCGEPEILVSEVRAAATGETP